MKVFSSFSGTFVDSSAMMAADRLVKLRRERPMWDVIDEVIKIWEKTKPREWKAHLVELKDLKETRLNKFASTKNKSLRFMLDIPEKVIFMIRKLYDVRECPMDKQWMLKFARRYPKMVVAEKL